VTGNIQSQKWIQLLRYSCGCGSHKQLGCSRRM